MTDAELSAWWPDLGRVVEGLRRIDRSSVANQLLEAVAAGCSSSEIIGNAGGLLHEYRALRAKLSATESDAWAAVMKDFIALFQEQDSGIGSRRLREVECAEHA